MTPNNFPHALLATLIPTPAATAKAETPAFVPHWRLVHPSGIPLVANTTRPLKDGAAAIVALGYVKNPATERIVLWLGEEGLEAFTPCTVQEALNG